MAPPSVTANSLGAILTPLIVTPIALQFGWRSAFLLTGGMSVCWIVMWTVIGRAPYLAEHRRASLNIRWPNFLERRLWLVVVSFGLGAVALGVVSYFSPLYLNRVLGLSQKELGRVLWIPLLGWEAGYYFWGWVADKRIAPGKRPVGLFCLLAVLALPLGAGDRDQFPPHHPRAVLLVDLHRRRLRRILAARRLAPVSARSNRDGRRHRFRRLVSRARGRAAGLRPLVRPEIVQRDLDFDEPAARARHAAVDLAEPFLRNRGRSASRAPEQKRERKLTCLTPHLTSSPA